MTEPVNSYSRGLLALLDSRPIVHELLFACYKKLLMSRGISLLLMPLMIVLLELGRLGSGEFAGAACGDELLSRRPLPPTWREDAELHDIFFWDGTNGWAVGDCGTILRTTDGGATWQECQAMRSINAQQQKMTPQMKALVNMSREAAAGLADKPLETVPSPISASLTSVHFIDAKRGWAIGGYSLPYVDRSRAVVMKTVDGGATWIPQANVMAPRLMMARFQSPTSGWAFGESGNLYKSGFLTTADGGVSWSVQDNSVRNSWRSGAVTPTGFVGVDEHGALRVFRGGKVEASIVRQRPLRPLRSVVMTSELSGWAVGDQGTLLQTEDGGVSWSVPEAVAKSEALRYYDLQTVTCVGSRVWFAGNPGSHVFCYDTASGSLTASRTGTTVGLNRLVFNGPRLGWACGQFGTILSTGDEGETWQIRRGGSGDLALLFLNWDDSLPALEAMARYGADEGLRAISCRIQTRAVNAVSWTRSAEAVTAAGCLGEIKLNAADPASGQTDWKQIELKLLQLIRQHRPRAVVSSQSMLRMSDGTILDVNELLQRVIKNAAAPDAEIGQAAATLTGAWQTSQVMLLQSGGGHWPLADNVFLTKLNRLLGDQVGHSRALFGSRLSRPDAVGLELLPCGDRVILDDRGTLSESFQRLGLQLSKRAGSGLTRGNLREVQSAMTKGQQVQSLLTQKVSTTGDQLVWQQAVGRLLQTADEETMGNWLGELAEQYFAAGDLKMTALTLEQMLVRVPHHGLAPAAQVWLAQFGSSREIETALTPPAAPAELVSDEQRELDELDQLIRDSQVEATAYESQILTIEQDGMKKMVWVPKPRENGKPEEKNPSQEKTPAAKNDFWQEASRQLNRVKQRDPELGALPQMRWLEAAATLQLAGWEAAQPLVQQLLRDPSAPSGLKQLAQRTAQAEQDNQGEHSQARVTRVETAPQLDGLLDDEIWNLCRSSGTPLNQLSVAGSAQAIPDADELWMAHDGEYLYLAIRCRKLPGVAYRARTHARERDERLEDHDRVVVSFDLDRDGYWPLSLSVDSRGAVADGCGPTMAWNPNWYVAQQATSDCWMVEAAIPLAQFGASLPASGTSWGVGVARHAPWQSSNLWSAAVGTAAAGTAGSSAPLQVPLQAAEYRLLQFE